MKFCSVYARLFCAAAAVIFMLSACNTLPKKGTADQTVPEKGQVEKPEDTAPSYEQIQKLMEAGDTAAAADEFEKIKTDDAESLNAYAGILMANGEYEKAEEVLAKLLEKEPGNSDALLNMALVKGIFGDIDSEKDFLEKAIEANPSNADASAIRGSLYLSEGKLKKAGELFESAIASDPDNIVALTGYGSTLVRQEEYEKAREYLDLAVELEPGNPFTYLDRSNVRAALGDSKGAEADLTSAINLEPDYFWHYIDRGRLRVREISDRQGALDDFTKAIELNPDNFYSYVFRAGIYDDMGELELAAADYRKLLELKPDYYFAYSSLATIQFITEDWDESRKSFEKAFRAEPEEYAFLAAASLAVMRQGDKTKTANYLKKTLDYIPVDNIYYHVIRSFRESNYDTYALRMIKEEEDINIRNKLLFYIAELYFIRDMKSAAYSYLAMVRDTKLTGFYEAKIAAAEIEKYFEDY